MEVLVSIISCRFCLTSPKLQTFLKEIKLLEKNDNRYVKLQKFTNSLFSLSLRSNKRLFIEHSYARHTLGLYSLVVVWHYRPVVTRWQVVLWLNKLTNHVLSPTCHVSTLLTVIPAESARSTNDLLYARMTLVLSIAWRCWRGVWIIIQMFLGY